MLNLSLLVSGDVAGLLQDREHVGGGAATNRFLVGVSDVERIEANQAAKPKQ